jgi:hypothetical protein
MGEPSPIAVCGSSGIEHGCPRAADSVDIASARNVCTLNLELKMRFVMGVADNRILGANRPAVAVSAGRRA